MKHISQAVLAAAVVAAVAGVVFFLVRASTSSGGIEIVLPTPAEDDVRVYVTGAVVNPGVHAVGRGARLLEAVEAAGGATDDADLTAVNLAIRVKDEDHWHIPRKGEVVQSSQRGAQVGPGKIDINSAGVDLLKSLPGIGNVKAQAIVSYREANGPFAGAEELLQVKGIGSATLDAIRDLVEAR